MSAGLISHKVLHRLAGVLQGETELLQAPAEAHHDGRLPRGVVEEEHGGQARRGVRLLVHAHGVQKQGERRQEEHGRERGAEKHRAGGQVDRTELCEDLPRDQVQR